MIFVFYWGQFTVIQLTVAQNPNDSFISQRIRIDQEILDNNTKISKDKCPNPKSGDGTVLKYNYECPNLDGQS